jgi:hypothetical protein
MYLSMSSATVNLATESTSSKVKSSRRLGSGRQPPKKTSNQNTSNCGQVAKAASVPMNTRIAQWSATS